MPDEKEVTRRRLKRRRWIASFGGVGVAVVVGLCCEYVLPPSAGPLPLLVGLLAGLATFVALGPESFSGRKLDTAHELIRAGLGAEALPILKELDRQGSREHERDSACYLTARAYHVQGAVKLALAYYREYGKRFPEGVWLIESKAHARDLRREERERKAVVLAAREESQLRCPYCHDELLLQKPHVECESCGTRYHDDCHAERGGCSVLGCARAPQAEERVSA